MLELLLQIVSVNTAITTELQTEHKVWLADTYYWTKVTEGEQVGLNGWKIEKQLIECDVDPDFLVIPLHCAAAWQQGIGWEPSLTHPKRQCICTTREQDFCPHSKTASDQSCGRGLD